MILLLMAKILLPQLGSLVDHYGRLRVSSGLITKFLTTVFIQYPFIRPFGKQLIFNKPKINMNIYGWHQFYVFGLSFWEMHINDLLLMI